MDIIVYANVSLKKKKKIIQHRLYKILSIHFYFIYVKSVNKEKTDLLNI